MNATLALYMLVTGGLVQPDLWGTTPQLIQDLAERSNSLGSEIEILENAIPGPWIVLVQRKQGYDPNWPPQPPPGATGGIKLPPPYRGLPLPPPSKTLPIAPTDPRAAFSPDFPTPPTATEPRVPPNQGLQNAGSAPRGSVMGLGPTNSEPAYIEKPFENYRAPPPFSPYLLLYARPFDRDPYLDPYTFYVRPLLEQRKAIEELDRTRENRGQGGRRDGGRYSR